MTALVCLVLNWPLRLGTDLTRVWCCYEFAWWLKHKGEGSIALVPLRMYSTILRLALKGFPPLAAVMNALLGLAFGFVVDFGRAALQHEHLNQARQREDYVNSMAFIVCCCFLGAS